MQIIIKHKDTEVSIKGSGDCIDKLVAAAEKLYGLVAAQECPLPDIIIPEEATAKLMPFPQSQKKEESFGIRERIPNNVVDVEQLDVKQAVTENALVRCPYCGQAHALIVQDSNKLYLMRKNYDKNEFQIVSEAELSELNQLLCYENKYVECFKDLQNAPEVTWNDFAVTNDSEIFCPVCHQGSSFMKWKDAWENPLHYFETDSICEICGGEVSIAVIKEGHVNGVCNKCKSEVIDGRPVPKQ